MPAFCLKEGTQWKREHIVDILLFNGREMWSVNQQWNPFLYWSWWFKNILLKSISFGKISLLHLMDNGSLQRKFYQNVTKRGWFGFPKCKIELLPSNKTAEIAFMKEDYIECRCQLLKANPTLAESFSETTGKVTLRLASIYFKIPNDQKWYKRGTNLNLRGVEVVTLCPNYLPSLH